MLIEQTIIEYLEAALLMPVYAERPEEKPPQYLVVSRLGGAESDRIPWIAAAVQSYAPTLYEAAALSDRARAAMERLTELPGICGCRMNSEAAFSDPMTRQPRYQAIFEISFYREEL